MRSLGIGDESGTCRTHHRQLRPRLRSSTLNEFLCALEEGKVTSERDITEMADTERSEGDSEAPLHEVRGGETESSRERGTRLSGDGDDELPMRSPTAH